MSGNDQVRHCSLCRLNVYNAAEMTEAEVLDLISKAEGRLCMRLTQRADGTLITRDCPVGRRLIRKRMAYALAMGAAILMTGLSWAASIKNGDEKTPFRAKCEQLKDELLAKEPFASWFPHPAPVTGMVAGSP